MKALFSKTGARESNLFSPVLIKGPTLRLVTDFTKPIFCLNELFITQMKVSKEVNLSFV